MQANNSGRPAMNFEPVGTFTVNKPIPSGTREPSFSSPSAASTTSDGTIKVVSKSDKKTKLVGVLACFHDDPNGSLVELRSGRWLVSSRPTDLGDYILIDDENVSPLHAVIRVTPDARVQILDQLSEKGTIVLKSESNEEVDVAGNMIELSHGDVIRFGQREFTACLFPNANH